MLFLPQVILYTDYIALGSNVEQPPILVRIHCHAHPISILVLPHTISHYYMHPTDSSCLTPNCVPIEKPQ